MRSPGTQTHIVMGHRTVARTDPDWVAMQVLEVVIGAGPGLTDLLSQRLRDDLGLVYSVGMATTDGAWRTPGYMRISFSCDPADAVRAEHEALQVMQQAAQGNISDQQCLEARDYLTRSWYLGFEAADDRLSNWLDTELDDWDLSLPPRWVQRCSSLTPDQIRKVARRRILPNHFQIVQYGP
jgi:zinc protease